MDTRNRRWIAGLAAFAVVGTVAVALLIGGAVMVSADGGGFDCPYYGPTGGWRNRTGDMMGGGYEHGMMGMMGGFGGGMMGGGFGFLIGAEPLSLEQAESAVEAYLADRGDPDLEIAEIMIFENHAYAEIVEGSTGIGAFEVLVDPVTLAVYPEPGPNMMWNLKYGHMGAAGGMMGGMMGMMGGWGWSGGSSRRGRGMMPWPELTTEPSTAPMPVSPEQAIDIAQRYLDANLPGVQAAGEADPFYGYYTIHTLRDDQVTGMLSVNGYSRQVFLHTWHGEFVAMSEGHEG